MIATVRMLKISNVCARWYLPVQNLVFSVLPAACESGPNVKANLSLLTQHALILQLRPEGLKLKYKGM
jgi:hypothetical protein